MNVLDNALLFLINTLFNLYILVVMLRILLQWAGAHFYNPVSQFVIKLTNPVIMPLRKLIKPLWGIDLAALIILILLEFIKLLLIIFIKAAIIPGIIGLIIWAFADLLSLFINIFFFAIIIAAIMSWFMPLTHNPIREALYLLTEPLMRPFRRIIPPIGGFDITPIPVLIILKLIDMVFVAKLLAIGISMALPIKM